MKKNLLAVIDKKLILLTKAKLFCYQEHGLQLLVNSNMIGS